MAFDSKQNGVLIPGRMKDRRSWEVSKLLAHLGHRVFGWLKIDMLQNKSRIGGHLVYVRRILEHHHDNGTMLLLLV